MHLNNRPRRRRLGEQVDADAVARQLRNGRTVKSVAAGLDIRPNTLRRYLSRAGWGSDGRRLRPEDDDHEDEPEQDDIAADAALPPDAVTEQALCAQVDAETFFPEKGGSTAAAKAICRRCAVRLPCAEWAIATRQLHGVWGGLSPGQRRDITRGKDLP